MWHNLDSYDAKKSKAIIWMSRIIRNQSLNLLKRKQIVDFVEDVPAMADPSHLTPSKAQKSLPWSFTQHLVHGLEECWSDLRGVGFGIAANTMIIMRVVFAV